MVDEAELQFTSTSLHDRMWNSLNQRLNLPPKNIVIGEATPRERSIQEQAYRECEQNKCEQMRVDSAIILNGFSEKPEVPKVVEDFLKQYELSIKEHVSSYYCFANKTMPKFYHIKIDMKKKMHQLLILGQMEMENRTKPLNIFGQQCLSRFNKRAHTILLKMKNNRYIADFKFEDFFFHVKECPYYGWKGIRIESDIEHLESLSKVLDNNSGYRMEIQKRINMSLYIGR